MDGTPTRPKTKLSKTQRPKTKRPGCKMSQIQDIPSLKTFQIQNVPNLKHPRYTVLQASKRP
jgi:hypothetical protein